jgi:hypothetical protein
MKKSMVIVALSVVALVLSTAALARGDEVVRTRYTAQAANTTSQAEEALAKLRAQEAAILKQMSDIYKSIAAGQKPTK